jgi:hypothetical protein
MEEEEKLTTTAKEPNPEFVAQFIKTLLQEAKQPNLTNSYANNTLFEVSGWDLKIYFGQLQQLPPKNDVDWHTAMTIPWTLAKVMEYYLRANIAFYQAKFAPINLPRQLRPPIPVPPTEEQIKDDPQATELWHVYKKIYEEVFGGN